jgi:hypothetical protein
MHKGAIRYEYCYDTVNNNICDASWLSAGTNTSVQIGSLTNNTTYYWQIRAIDAVQNVIYPPLGWWSFIRAIP